MVKWNNLSKINHCIIWNALWIVELDYLDICSYINHLVGRFMQFFCVPRTAELWCSLTTGSRRVETFPEESTSPTWGYRPARIEALMATQLLALVLSSSMLRRNPDFRSWFWICIRSWCTTSSVDDDRKYFRQNWNPFPSNSSSTNG